MAFRGRRLVKPKSMFDYKEFWKKVQEGPRPDPNMPVPNPDNKWTSFATPSNLVGKRNRKRFSMASIPFSGEKKNPETPLFLRDGNMMDIIM